ncbi:HAMP domain-containing histidine kinase [Patescibacteria group bacterium]|nr:HAMP domain-containing histidine kinase [Patescibacteria group bacterium]
MNLKPIYKELNIFSQCKRYGLPLWQCPQFLFVVMGIFTIATIFTSYALGARYISDPQIVILLVFLITAVLFIISFIITQSFERLAEASRMKSEFINIISHQLRSPLTNLRWAVDLLISGDLGNIEEKQLEFFKILKENGSRMEELISDLLIISRMETEKTAPQKTEFSLEDLVNELISKARAFAMSYNVEIKVETARNLPMLFGDVSQIELVIENLLDNAIKYIHPIGDIVSNGVKGDGEIKISIFKKDKNIYFEIKDNGLGIPKEDQKYIFQKFFRSENARRAQTQGSGLGLFICKSTIKNNGGKIGFKSEENKGSTFWFTLPLRNY